MMENLKELILMDGNGLFVWFCLIFFLLVLTLNIIFSYRRKLKIVKSIKNK
jgi:heme exporter protein D